jgi:type IV secretory pathway TrbL component
MKPPSELGTTRKRELQSAQKAVEVAKGHLAELTATLAKHREGQAALAPATSVTASANVATLAQSMQLQSAASVVIAHLENAAIPAAKAEVQRTGRLLATQQDNILRKRAHIAEQQRIIAKAQAEIARLGEWMAT